MVDEGEGNIALAHEQSGIYDTLKRFAGGEYGFRTARYVELAETHDLLASPRFEPRILWLGVDIQQEATRAKGGMDVLQGTHGAFRSDASD